MLSSVNQQLPGAPVVPTPTGRGAVATAVLVLHHSEGSPPPLTNRHISMVVLCGEEQIHPHPNSLGSRTGPAHPLSICPPCGVLHVGPCMWGSAQGKPSAKTRALSLTRQPPSIHPPLRPSCGGSTQLRPDQELRESVHGVFNTANE